MVSRAVPAVGIAAVTALAAALLMAGAGEHRDLDGTFELDAVYHAEPGLVRITYEDTSRESTSVVLEVWGMDESFQRRYERTGFTEEVPFGQPPKFGWKVHPVVLAVEHPELGRVGIKTEIRAPDEPKPPVIYSRP